MPVRNEALVAEATRIVFKEDFFGGKKEDYGIDCNSETGAEKRATQIENVDATGTVSFEKKHIEHIPSPMRVVDDTIGESVFNGKSPIDDNHSNSRSMNSNATYVTPTRQGVMMTAQEGVENGGIRGLSENIIGKGQGLSEDIIGAAEGHLPAKVSARENSEKVNVSENISQVSKREEKSERTKTGNPVHFNTKQELMKVREVGKGTERASVYDNFSYGWDIYDEEREYRRMGIPDNGTCGICEWERCCVDNH